MNRLFVKIFFWFWLGIVAVTGALILAAEATYSRADDDQLWQETYSPRVQAWSREAAHILDVEGVSALALYVKTFERWPVGHYIFDASGHEILGQRVPTRIVELLHPILTSSRSRRQQFFPNERFIATSIFSNGRWLLIVADFPKPSPLSRLLSPLTSVDLTPLTSMYLTRTLMIRVGAALLVAIAVCFLFAQQIVKPIERLRAATREIAEGHLNARVDERVLAHHDELGELGRDFDQMADRIERLVNGHRQFLADVSHELRSPLARLHVALGLIRLELRDVGSEHLERSEREVARLEKLIGQLLVMARLKGGIDPEHRSTFALGPLIEEIAADANYEARNLSCTLKFVQRGECWIEGAREMIRGAIENVMRNAIHYTSADTEVEVSMTCRDKNQHSFAVIEIRDHGPGVPTNALKSLFTPFYRCRANERPDAEGTGLGLAITRHTFEFHGGNASAANAPGGGLLVTLELPATRTSAFASR